MTAGEKLISVSNLVGCNTASDHFCSIVTGSTTRVYGTYGVKYIPSVRSKMKYVLPNKIDVKYVPKPTIEIVYLKSEKQYIKYNPSPTIKITYKCKP